MATNLPTNFDQQQQNLAFWPFLDSVSIAILYIYFLPNIVRITMEKLQKFKLRLPLIINTVFALVFFVHSTMIGYGIMYPDEPTTKFYRKKFSDLDLFPLNFKICVKELTNPNHRYSKFGYKDIWKYKGTGGDDWDDGGTNGTWVGSAGHTKNNSTISSAEGKIHRWHGLELPSSPIFGSDRSPRSQEFVCPSVHMGYYSEEHCKAKKPACLSKPDCSLLSFYFRN